MENGDKVARRDSLGTVIEVFRPDEKPEGFEGEWPESGRGLVVVAWPGRKRLGVVPRDSLIVVST